jgi:hypothetical protein
MSKKALIVGINRFTRAHLALRGCINDTLQVAHLLQTFYGFQDDDIRFLRDKDATQARIHEGLRWLLSEYAGDGSDVRVFHFSSHGTQVDDQDGDEWEQLDQVIVPHDHDWEHPFRDDDLREHFGQVPENVHFTFIADCCHSGTMQRAASRIEFKPRFAAPPADVEARIKRARETRDAKLNAFQAAAVAQALPNLSPDQLESAILDLLTKSKQTFIEVNYGIQRYERNVLLAASESSQTAADARIDGEWRGALTWSLSEAIVASNGDLTYAQLIERAANNLSEYDQRPQLECPDHLRDQRVFAPLG